MHILAVMAVVAIHRKLEIGRRLRLVAGLASHFLMHADKRKSRLPSVIETPARPSIWIVAGGAIGAEPCLMEVLVAFLAGERRVLIGRRPMTFLAGN